MKNYNDKTRYRLVINETEVVTTFASDVDAFNFASVFVTKRDPFKHLSLENLKTGEMLIRVRKSD